jgi:hypothetical protein
MGDIALSAVFAKRLALLMQKKSPLIDPHLDRLNLPPRNLTHLLESEGKHLSGKLAADRRAV